MQPNTHFQKLSLALALIALPCAVLADPGKDESGHGKHRHGRHEFKEEYWDGHCKVERKLEKNGTYKEERKCKGQGHGGAVVYVPAAPVVPGVVIQGTVVLK